jgi:hypothetical protein
MLIFHCAKGWNRRRSHGGDRRCFLSNRRWLRRCQTQLPCLVLCPRWRSLFSVRQTLVLGVTDADISICRLTLVHALLKEATDVVVLNRRTCLLHSGKHRPYWTVSIGATNARAILDRRVSWSAFWPFELRTHRTHGDSGCDGHGRPRLLPRRWLRPLLLTQH